MLKQRLTEEEIQKLALLVAEKCEATGTPVDVARQVLEAYVTSIEFFQRQNEEYFKNRPPGITVL